MSSPGITTRTPMPVGSPTGKSQSPDAMEIDIKEEDDEDVIAKLRDVEVLPQLFNLLHDLETGIISVRDFDNNAGSVRLKLNTLKQYLQEVEGMNESIEARCNRIEALKKNNERKSELLRSFRSRVQSVFGVEIAKETVKSENYMDLDEPETVDGPEPNNYKSGEEVVKTESLDEQVASSGELNTEPSQNEIAKEPENGSKPELIDEVNLEKADEENEPAKDLSSVENSTEEQQKSDPINDETVKQEIKSHEPSPVEEQDNVKQEPLSETAAAPTADSGDDSEGTHIKVEEPEVEKTEPKSEETESEKTEA